MTNFELPFEKRLLYFEVEGHRYTDDRKCVYTSTTTIIHHHVPAYETKSEARRLSKQGTGIYRGKSAKQIEAMWTNVTSSACEKGTGKHDGLEQSVKTVSKFTNAVKYLHVENNDNRLYTIDDILDISGVYKYTFNLVEFYDKIGKRYPIIYKTIKWYVDNGYEIYAEVGVYDPNSLISGMIDLLAIHKGRKSFCIIDWKTNKDDIQFKAGYYKRDSDTQSTKEWVDSNKRLLFPLDNLANCNGIIYTLQLSIYAHMLIIRGWSFDGCILFHIRDQFILNKYGTPLKGNDGMYTIDTRKPETVEYYMISYLDQDVKRLFANHVKHNLQNENFKLNF